MAKTKRQKPKKDLDARYEMFASAYVASGLNGTKAAIASGYSEKTAHSQASRLLTKVKVKKLVQKKIRETLSNTDELTMQWLNEVRKLAFSDIRKALNDDGSPKPVSCLDDDIAAAVEGLTNVTQYRTKKNGDDEETTTHSVRLAQKTKALDLLGKYLAILHDNPPEPVDEEEKQTAKEKKERLAYLLNKANNAK